MWQPDTWPIVYAIASSAKPNAKAIPNVPMTSMPMMAVPGPMIMSTAVPMNSAAKIRTSETAGVGGVSAGTVMDAPLGVRDGWSEVATSDRGDIRFPAREVSRPSGPPRADDVIPSGRCGRRDRGVESGVLPRVACPNGRMRTSVERQPEDLLRRLALHDETAIGAILGPPVSDRRRLRAERSDECAGQTGCARRLGSRARLLPVGGRGRAGGGRHRGRDRRGGAERGPGGRGGPGALGRGRPRRGAGVRTASGLTAGEFAASAVSTSPAPTGCHQDRKR